MRKNCRYGRVDLNRLIGNRASTSKAECGRATERYARVVRNTVFAAIVQRDSLRARRYVAVLVIGRCRDIEVRKLRPVDRITA